VVARSQLLGLGLNARAIEHRIAKGRLHRVWRGVYAVGRADLSERGRWMAAVLRCGPEALLSHRSAGALWGIVAPPPQNDISSSSRIGASNSRPIDVTIPHNAYRRVAGIRIHRRVELGPEHRREVDGIPVTDLVSTLFDLASCLPTWQLERAINEADRLDLIDPEALRAAIDRLPRRPGLARLRNLLDRKTRTDSGLESRFLPLARQAGLPAPETQVWLNGFRVDFHWPDLGLVVESDGWRYHRTPSQQAKDHRRDQVHTAAGLTALRFGEEQIRYEPEEVRKTLAAVAARLAAVGLRPETSRL
jgi:very-short-patch-repair endonuclease